MAQRETWEREYRKPLLLTKNPEPQNDLKRFLKFLRKEAELGIDGLKVLDIGCGTGRNANFLAQQGCEVSAFDISSTAVNLGRLRADEVLLEVDYKVHSMGEPWPYADQVFDVLLDVMASNSLRTPERKIYLREAHRVLKPGGYFFVKALCKDGDKNAKNLLSLHPGPEEDTYVMPEMDLIERVFSRQDFEKFYSQLFHIVSLDKKTNYNHFGDQTYKRNYWIAYLQKK